MSRNDQGLPTIRAYGAGPRFLDAFVGNLDANGAWWFAFISTARWIGFRLDFISAVMLTAGSILAMAIHDKVAFPQLDRQWPSHLSCVQCPCSCACWVRDLTHAVMPLSTAAGG